jgi:hypothetical protein
MRRDKSRHKYAVGVKRQHLQQRGQQESTDTGSTISSIHASTDMTMMNGSGFVLDLGPGFGRLDTLDSTADSLGFLGDTDCSNGSSISIGSGKLLEQYFAADECSAEAADTQTGEHHVVGVRQGGCAVDKTTCSTLSSGTMSVG